jgi:hypothetical protein
VAEGEEGEAPAEPGAPPATSPSRSARAQARLAAAIERVGGHEPVREALQPKRRDDGEAMKWSAVCAEQAQAYQPGDPEFTAWVRLAATPVRDVKAIVNPRGRDDDRRGGRRGGRRSERGPGRDAGREPARSGGRGSREDLQEHGRDGSFRSSVRIVHVDAEGQRKEPEEAPDPERKERDDEQRAERDAKRQAEAERLARLGY